MLTKDPKERYFRPHTREDNEIEQVRVNNRRVITDK